MKEEIGCPRAMPRRRLHSRNAERIDLKPAHKYSRASLLSWLRYLNKLTYT